MEVRITHCAICLGYRARALALAEELRARFRAPVEVAEGKLGQFDVHVDGRLVVSRDKRAAMRLRLGHLPDAAAVIAAIENELAAPNQLADRKERGVAFGPEDAKRFYDRFGSKQDAQIYERAALNNLIAHGDFEQASSVFELGCGTGRLAVRLFRERLSAQARYVGIDISKTMVEMASARLAPWGGRAIVKQVDGTTKLPYPPGEFDRFVTTYVLDLFPPDSIDSVLQEAHRLLSSQGKLCVVVSTEGIGPISRLVCRIWKSIYARNPRLVGGCRPLRMLELLDRSVWRPEYMRRMSSWGISSEIVIAAPIK